MQDDDNFNDDANEEFDVDEDDDAFPDDDREIELEMDAAFSEVSQGDKLSSFLVDPWPKLTLLLTIIGLFIAILIPHEVWHTEVQPGVAAGHLFVGNYLILILATGATVLALTVWNTQKGWLKYGGLTNVVVILICVVIATADTIAWSLTGHGLFPSIFDAPMLSILAIIIMFCIYSLWMIRKTPTD